MAELDAKLVARRLAVLRQAYVPASESEARAKMEERPPSRTEPFDEAVARRLDELRSLLELTAHLHAGTCPSA